MKSLLFFLIMTMPALAQNTVHIDQIGNNNIVIIDQIMQSKSATVTIKGDWNEFYITQQGIGNHAASITQTYSISSNNNNQFSIDQRGNGNHTANILMTNTIANSSNTASIYQHGNIGADKSFNLTLNGNGIDINIIQNNPVVPDIGNMTITCLTPPCTGYSYIRN